MNRQLIEIARKKHLIHDVSASFKMFPFREIDGFVIGEGITDYGNIQIGDIVFVPEYHYINGKEGNNHLFLIVDQSSLLYYGMLISSRINKIKYSANFFLKKDNINHLAKDSIIKTDILYQINNLQIAYKIGHVKITKVNKYIHAFLKFLK